MSSAFSRIQFFSSTKAFRLAYVFESVPRVIRIDFRVTQESPPKSVGKSKPTSSTQVIIQKVIVGTALYLNSRMSRSSKAPEGLKDVECKKGKLGFRSPIPYVPPTDLLQTKENTDTLKVKLSDGTVFPMSIFAKGNP